MSEYICEKCDVFFDNEKMPSGDSVIKRMTIDINVKEEITRCRDCKHYTEKAITCGAEVLGYDCSLLSAVVEPDGFCAWAVRRGA